MADPAAEYLKLYEEYNKSLRTWFLSFGIGAIVLLLSNDALASKFAKSPEKAYIVAAFLAGCFLQVLIALLNKDVLLVYVRRLRQRNLQAKLVL